MKKPGLTMQIIMAAIYLALIAGTVTACIILNLNGTCGLVEIILIIAVVAIICIPFPAYFIYILIKNAIGRNAVKKDKVFKGIIGEVEPLSRKSLSVFFARFAIKCGESTYYTNYIYYTNDAKNLKGITVDFAVNKNIAYIKNFYIEKK